MHGAESFTSLATSDTFTVTPVSAFDDNYIWVISQPSHSFVYVVDPGDAEVVIRHLQQNNQTLAGILITHHHDDHTGGVEKLIGYANEELEIFGPATERIPNINAPLQAGSEASLSRFGCPMTVIDVPGHTLGHIAYLIGDSLFCGDTLFSGGCGRIFEGTPEQMHQSLQAFARLPDNIKVFCAHEYTVSNLKFALAVDPENTALSNYNKQCLNLRSKGEATLPSSMGLERKINPFLRCDSPAIKHSVCRHFEVEHSDTVTTFGLLRQWKDNF
ncbi:hydroxyacylglutathione hydrolase [uncultured Shewanella sp.]|uniref:hydroxyacylglutathione hydrolase n=1 Tax=Shewanella atlantica TaxID=271099 RepID=UPI0026334F0B|nr:hydroxyacylglutathione hydrolase [uncultured Shewanella sp.]